MSDLLCTQADQDFIGIDPDNLANARIHNNSVLVVDSSTLEKACEDWLSFELSIE